MQSVYNWKEKREKKAILALEDGSIYTGYSFGAEVDIEGEVVFNTGMTGYQEILSDPSYSGQFVTMTYPEIGNTGINEEDMESRTFFLNGFIAHNINIPSNWRSKESLSEALKKNGIPGIAGIDTRALTSELRKVGTLKAFIHCSSENRSPEECVERAKKWEGLENKDYASKVTCKKPYEWDEDGVLSTSWGMTSKLSRVDYNIVAYDYGIKWNILRSLRLNGFNVRVVPAQTTSEEVLRLKPDGVFLSNGPADPAALPYAVDAVEGLIGKVPVMGICLGHQILSMACGAERYKLKFGHHGCNHPVKNLETGNTEITSQNHNFAIDAESLGATDLEITHINLNDNTVEGVKHKNGMAFSVQYHPEAAPGPHDPSYLFKQFQKLVEAN